MPPPPPPTQATFELDASALQQALHRHAPPPVPNPPPNTFVPSPTPKLTPGFVRTSQLDSLFNGMNPLPTNAPRPPIAMITAPRALTNLPPAAVRPAPFITSGMHDGVPFTQTTATSPVTSVGAATGDGSSNVPEAPSSSQRHGGPESDAPTHNSFSQTTAEDVAVLDASRWQNM
ncbi:uncharacterized protein MELLADRAFT_114280 [Melampsora larici-populina 98AG31]|uniref:Uncharacterized protein n=1 Tax=Melampsora larici-populina (strain 98AG31 / pathotype 3-4-7) TaxID=747676 RepID=F4SCW3_MELLP|nr:uncharacterized protein MELLADRAFT_114280 [Melampsora larici-populina 98AG31]EGF97508.1 hypothetical protein MELLADRAFT_114280 [Melampsora larici-populina 98AG31]